MKTLNLRMTFLILERVIVARKAICSLNMLRVLSKFSHNFFPLRMKHTLDYSKLPLLSEKDLKEQFVRGSGPGGQATNKNANCVVLKHLPTGVVVKSHQSRSLDVNRKEARRLLTLRIDKLLNGEDSLEAQEKKIQDKKSTDRKRKREKLEKLKAEWKERENLE